MTAGELASVKRLSDWNHDRLLSLAESHRTPLYVLDLDRIEANYKRFTTAFPDADVMYAAKAHTGQAVLSQLLDAGATIECAAAGELKRAIRAGADPNNLQYTAVNPPAEDLDYAASLGADYPGLTITGGARDTFDRLAERGYDGRVAIRVNPGIGTGHHEKVATGKDAKFGIPYGEVQEVAADLRDQFDLVGLHAHMGSGVLHDDLDAHCEAIAKVADLAATVGDLEFVDIGGGFGVPYREDESPLDLAVVSDRVREAVDGLDATLKLEPGRYIVADAELILTRVNTIKEAPSTTVVGVDASIATLVRPAMFGSYHPIRNITAPNRENSPVSIGGPCCTSADVFATNRPIAKPTRDDILAIGNAGAYGYELASQFHSQPRPAEVTLSGDVVRRRETLDDVLRVEEEAQ
ncbi:diaminopimelate decarboxylase [Salinarchaeum sp. IM2453]|uniref:diaminopimelate decarboxylase n=1 Tax=Salinarchaeum sp. IM2453 TaxID=2862870 RepID=UPI001C82B070|nr:diaminopimelate decarboxylase [Salinarchaeum sp. IM2453]QZA88918.1 diaminopimelate decarboxylase [Salinarchaeum sp. IM2453]